MPALGAGCVCFPTTFLSQHKETTVQLPIQRRTTIRLVVAAAGLAISAMAMAQETIKVGLLLTYSGSSGVGGQLADHAIQLFQKKYGTTVAGKKIEFVKRDTTGPNPEVVKRLAQELIVREKVHVMIGVDFTPNVLAVAPLVTEGKVPTIQTGAATSGIVGERSPYFLRTFFSIPQLIRPLAEWAVKNDLKKTYVVVADYGPGHDSEAQFNKAYTALGGTIAGNSRVPVRNPEFSSYMQRIKDANPDAVLAFFPMGELVPQFLKAYANAGLKDTKIKLIGTADMTDEGLLDASGDTSLGVITSSPYSDAHDSPENKALVADFNAVASKIGRFNVSAVAVWDALRLIYDGVAAQGNAKFDPDKFMAFTRGHSFDSPRGPVTIDKTTGDITQNIYIRRVERQDGVLKNVEMVTFPNVPAK